MKKLFIIAIAAIVVSGCASLTTNNNLAIERIDSIFATIRNVRIEKSEDGILYVRGNIKRRYSNIGKIPGHINVDILNTKGKVISQNVARLKKKSLTFDLARG